MKRQKKASPWSCDSWRRMGGQGDPGLEVPVVTDWATDMTAEGGMRAASWSTLGLIGSSTGESHAWKLITVFRNSEGWKNKETRHEHVGQLKRRRRSTTFDQLSVSSWLHPQASGDKFKSSCPTFGAFSILNQATGRGRHPVPNIIA